MFTGLACGRGDSCNFFLKEFLFGVSFCEGNHILLEEGKSFWLEEQFLVFLSLCWVLSVETAGKSLEETPRFLALVVSAEASWPHLRFRPSPLP